ncbi:MAG: LPXTG cell wall anchor domain-containing protein [Streptococcus mitis]|nr:LPXTG cell wall anchor domain-containing protein [Streptococcus mitis]
MNKLTKLGIVTFSTVTLSAVVPTWVRAEENVAPQPNVAAKPNTTQPTPKDPQPAETEKPAEISKPVETVKPTEQPKPAENKPVENKPAENPQPEVKPAEQAQPDKPVEPAENAGLPKVPYRNDQPKRWFNNGTGRPTLTTNDLAAPLPAENVEKTSYGWWTAEPDLLHAGSHIKVNTFNSNFNNPMFENGKEIKFKGSGFGDMDSRFKPALVRVKVPELEGMNYEAYTIFYEVPNKNGKPTYGTNRTLQGGGISLTIKSKENKEDIQVYTLTKDRKLEELYYPGFPSEETNRYDEKTKTHSYNLFGETYDTYVFLFKNPAEKPAEQVKPEVKPSEQPKPDKQPSVPTVPAEQPQPTKPVEPAEKPIEKPVVPDTPKPVAPAIPDQPQPAKPEKPTEQSVNPVAPVTPTTPVTPTLNPAIPNNTRVLSNKAGSVRVHGSEATLKNVSYIKVEETKSTSLESKDYKAFDIHLYDANGKAIQPNGMVLVSLSADKPVENVYYVAPDGTLQALNFKQDTDKVTFETNHFSIYAMTFKVAASRDNGGTTTPVPVVNSNNTPTTTEQKGNDASSTKTQAEPLATKTETISKQVAKTLPNTGENHSILATLFGMLTLTAGLFSFRKESE